MNGSPDFLDRCEKAVMQVGQLDNLQSIMNRGDSTQPDVCFSNLRLRGEQGRLQLNPRTIQRKRDQAFSPEESS